MRTTTPEGGKFPATASGALRWMESLTSNNSQVFFRGQTAIYESILPSLMRPNIIDEDRRAWWGVTRHFISSRSGLTGYHINSPHDALGIIQHYLLKSPVIDVTGTPKIALYFAIGKVDSETERVIYAIEKDALRDAGFAVADHAFLALPLVAVDLGIVGCDKMDIRSEHEI